jgi:1,4-dihydroxy-2-naphthoyl-CoA hydrolase
MFSKMVSMFVFKTIVRMRDTDATGNIYFTAQLEMAMQSFEELLRLEGLSLSELVTRGEYVLPVVHAEANYLSPMQIGDEVEVHLTVSNIGTASFSLAFDFVKTESDIIAGNATITHVVVAKGSEKSISIPSDLLRVLQEH